MELYLIRHGETVDNVAGVYAGVRDSALTNHGVEQAQRLGKYFHQQDVRFSHIFASPLSRARRTAEAVASHQKWSDERSSLRVIQVPDLIEQDFGYYEGKTFRARADAQRLGRDAQRERSEDEAAVFVDVESKDSMMKRADAFLDEHLLPLFFTEVDTPGVALQVAVVSHGILLGNLWRRLLARLPVKSVTISPDVTSSRGSVILEHLGGWSNTGYLNLTFTKPKVPVSITLSSATALPSAPPAMTATTGDEEARSSESADLASITPAGAITSTSERHVMLTGWSARINAIDSKQHLASLKRQRGGIGSSAHDQGQQRLESFFKRQKKNISEPPSKPIT
jgi:broad specificity phosphatase PhoE